MVMHLRGIFHAKEKFFGSTAKKTIVDKEWNRSTMDSTLVRCQQWDSAIDTNDNVLAKANLIASSTMRDIDIMKCMVTRFLGLSYEHMCLGFEERNQG